MSRGPDLLRAQLDRDHRQGSAFAATIARWLSTDVRALGRLRFELERCRLHHQHEVGRLRALLDGRPATPPGAQVTPPSPPRGETDQR